MSYTIREILSYLYNINETNGLTEEELDFLENKFGKLPKALTEFYALCGHCDNILVNQDIWITPRDYKKWSWLNDNKYMVLLDENQGVYIAAILEEDLRKDNPSVYVSSDSGETWELCADSLENFIKAALIYEAVFSFPYSAETIYTLTEDEVALVKEKLSQLPYHLENWFGKVWLFQDLPNSAAFVLEVDGDFQVLYGASSKEAFQRIASRLNGIGEKI